MSFDYRYVYHLLTHLKLKHHSVVPVTEGFRIIISLLIQLVNISLITVAVAQLVTLSI
jgi:hypothetical protein